MKQVLETKGIVSVEEVPAPIAEAGRILVATSFSCISTGTELSGLRSSATPLWRKALDKPQHVSKVLQIARDQGLRAALDAVEAKTATPKALGYSLAGIVVDIGAGVVGFKVGDHVACAGAQCANHAELVSIPVNLAVHVPADVSLEEASSVALGSIALQGVRRLEATLGEKFLVIGLGPLGQITSQLLKANGCQVVGVDLNSERTKLALQLGMDQAIDATDDLVLASSRLTHSVGFDGIIITASGNAPELLSQAFRSCRKKGRVVLVGDVPLQFERADLYEKELDFRISTSYGPGRYDRYFEEMGVEYPIAYVRWTETRNMAAYLELIRAKRIQIQPLIQGSYPVQEASKAFAALRSSTTMTCLLSYPQHAAGAEKKLSPAISVQSTNKKIPNLAIIGAGSFTENVHLPNLRTLSNRFTPGYIVCRTGHKAKAIADRYGFTKAETDWQVPLRDPNVDAVLIGTRHDQHASLALEFLKAGKHVLVEKPLAIEAKELDLLENFFASAKQATPILMTGFNRRFSPSARLAKEKLLKRAGPAIIQYTLNAGFIPQDHWVHGHEGGGRNIGEACHIYDLFVFLLGNAKPTKTNVTSIGSQASYRQDDNFQTSFEFSDGSMASLLYTSAGNSSLPKEEMKLFFDGQVFVLNDYKESSWMPKAGKRESVEHDSKGHKEELVAFFDAIAAGVQGISLQEQFLATRMSLEVQELLMGNTREINR